MVTETERRQRILQAVNTWLQQLPEARRQDRLTLGREWFVTLPEGEFNCYATSDSQGNVALSVWVGSNLMGTNRYNPQTRTLISSHAGEA